MVRVSSASVARNLFWFCASLTVAFSSLAKNRTWVDSSLGKKIQAEQMLKHSGPVWGFDFLKNGHLVFAEKSGKIFLWSPENKSAPQALSGLPRIKAVGQGGLLDIAIRPETDEVFFSFTDEVKAGQYTTSIARAKIEKDKLTSVEVFFQAQPARSTSIHFGSRIVFPSPETLVFTVGDRNDRDEAQNSKSDLGKIIRWNLKSKRKESFSLGHRNPQGLVWISDSQQLWSTEFGPRGGDELNKIDFGKNYGWPKYTYGREYYGPKIGLGFSAPGFESPIFHWTPSVSPSGLLFYTGDLLSELKNHFLVAGLGSEQLLRLEMDFKSLPPRVVSQKSLFKDQLGRLRSLRADSKGRIWISTDEGSLIALSPAT